MSTDIFGKTTASFGGAFSADDAIITFSRLTDGAGGELGGTVPLLVQNMSMQYQQAITRLFNLANNDVYYIRGRAAGQSSISQVIGPSRLAASFLRTYGDVCRAKTNILDLTIQGGCNADGQVISSPVSYKALYCVVSTVGLQVTAEQMVVQQNMNMTIAALEYRDT